MRLLPSPPSRIDAGRILFAEKDLAAASQREMQKIRGDRIGMVFQEPMTSLNPTLRIGEQIAEPLMLHRGMRRAQADEEVIRVLRQVGIGNAERRLLQYPHELSGGLRQRVMIAEMCETIAVMYAGRIVETGRTADVFARPHHPYTFGLLNSSPRRAKKGERLPSIPGLVPPPGARGTGCSFAARCPNALERCRLEAPPLVSMGSDAAACWNPMP